MSNSTPPVTSDLRAVVERIGAEVAGPAAAEVDREARFPHEAIDALRAEGLLGALIPRELGGLGHDLSTVAQTVHDLARHCASSAMVLAMHHIMVASMVRHGGTPALDTFARRVADEQLLLASATTEIGIGGDVRRSTCAVEVDGERFSLTKKAPVISYGEHADAILVTARRTLDSPPSDQVMVVVMRDDVSLEPLSGWDTFGFRGTCSSGFTLTASGDASLVCADDFATISSVTLLPTAHLLWSSLWLGIADEAIGRARAFVQAAARRSPGERPPGAARLAEVLTTRAQLAGPRDALLAKYMSFAGDADAASSVDFMLEINALKVLASTLVVDIVGECLLICGIQGYREDTAYSLGRLLRDAHGAAVMVNNDRILGHVADQALMQRGRG